MARKKSKKYSYCINSIQFILICISLFKLTNCFEFNSDLIISEINDENLLPYYENDNKRSIIKREVTEQGSGNFERIASSTIPIITSSIQSSNQNVQNTTKSKTETTTTTNTMNVALIAGLSVGGAIGLVALSVSVGGLVYYFKNNNGRIKPNQRYQSLSNLNNRLNENIKNTTAKTSKEKSIKKDSNRKLNTKEKSNLSEVSV